MIYTIEAHPFGSVSPYTDRDMTNWASTDSSGRPLTQPETYTERVQQASAMVRELGVTVPVLIDEMDNSVCCTYGPAPDIAYFIDQDGTIRLKQLWYEPSAMETFITGYLEEDSPPPTVFSP